LGFAKVFGLFGTRFGFTTGFGFATRFRFATRSGGTRFGFLREFRFVAARPSNKILCEQPKLRFGGPASLR
jgi:hypothetical protein